MDVFNEIITKIGNELNIRVTLLSDNWLTILEKDHKIRYIQGYKFGLNDHGIGNIMDDKGLFYDLLKYKDIPIIEHKVIFNNYDKQMVIAYFNQHNHKIVVKGNIGTCGKEVFLIDDLNNLFKTIDELFLKEFSISLCPYYEIKHEYRAIMLNNEVKYLYGKTKPMVIGDGKRTLLELAKEFNYDYYSNLEKYNFDPKYVPKLKEKVFLNFQFNLSKGAKSFTVIDEFLKEKLIFLAKKVTSECHIIFGSVDIIETIDNKLLVIEANSGVMMDNLIKQNDNGYNIAYNIYKEAIKMMFEV